MQRLRAKHWNNSSDNFSYEFNFSRGSPRHAGECPGYTQYIRQNYNNLEDYTIFLHGSNSDHTDGANLYAIIAEVKKKIERGERHFPLYNFGKTVKLNYVHRKNPECSIIAKALGFEEIFTVKQDVACCAQFVVRKDIIRRRSLDWWNLAYKLAVDYETCSCFEHAWNFIWKIGARLPTSMRFVSLQNNTLDSPQSIQAENRIVEKKHTSQKFVCMGGIC